MTVPAIPLTITAAGLARFTAAQVADDIDLAISSVGVTDADFVVAPTLEVLPGEFRRIEAISGEAVGPNMVHMIIRDDDALRYTVRGVGLFLDDGTLFAVYGQPTPLFEKSALATLLIAIDIAFPVADVGVLTFGDTNFLNPPATIETMGVVELATQDEADAGVDDRRVAPISVMAASIANAVTAVRTTLSKLINDNVAALSAAVIEAVDGLSARTTYGSGLAKGGGRNDSNRLLTVEAATGDDIRSGARLDAAVTPAALRDARVLYVVDSREGYRALSDGTVEQWGIADYGRTSEGAFALNFPTPFPTECTGIFTMTRNSNQTDLGLTNVQEVGLFADHAALYAQNHNSALSESGGFRWRAWGR